MDVHAKLEEIVAEVEAARAMPMSASCLLNRGELLGHLDELRSLLPEEVTEARGLLRERESIIAEGRREADRIVGAAREERARLIAKTEIAQEAGREADRLVGEAQEQAQQMRAEVEDYVDSKLANFEVVLQKTIAAVERGRAKLAGRHELSDLRGPTTSADEADAALPE